MAKTDPLPVRYQLSVGHAFNATACQYGWTPTTPSGWFAFEYPDAAMNYGCPFLEANHFIGDQLCVEPVEMNDDFFAMVLKGDAYLNHHVVFYEPDRCFYFRDGDRYYPTTEAKLKNLLSGLLLRCAGDMGKSVDVKRMFIDFRQDKRLQMIIVKARSMLAADSTFFSVNSPNQRVEGRETNAQVTRIFVENNVQPKADEKMTIQQTYEAFQQYCQQHGLVVVDRRAFKQLIEEIIREQYGIGPRNDIKDPQGGCKRGWSGLTLKSRFELAG